MLKWTDLTLSLSLYAMENSTTVLFFTHRERTLYCIVFDMCSVMQFGFFPEERNCDWQQVYSIYYEAWRGATGVLSCSLSDTCQERTPDAARRFVVSRGPRVACCVWAALLPHRLGKKIRWTPRPGALSCTPTPDVCLFNPTPTAVRPPRDFAQGARSASACARSLGSPPHLPHPWLTVVLVLQIAADLLHEGLE